MERRRHPSIERRLLLWLALLHAAVLAIFAVAYARHHFPDPEEVATHALKDWSLELADALSVDSAGGVRFHPSPVLARDLAAQSDPICHRRCCRCGHASQARCNPRRVRCPIVK